MKKKQQWKKFPLTATPDECRDSSLRHAEPSVGSQPATVETASSTKRAAGRVLRHRPQKKVMPPPVHHQRHNAGSKIAVVLIGLPAAAATRSDIERLDSRRAARMMMGRPVRSM